MKTFDGESVGLLNLFVGCFAADAEHRIVIRLIDNQSGQ
jgi:hypothetical protein